MKINTRIFIGAFLALGIWHAAAFSQGALLSHVQIDEFTISPDGDGVQDSLSITYTLDDTAFAVDVMIRSSDSAHTVIDSLIGGMSRSAGTYVVSWKGTGAGELPVPEGDYQAYVRAFNSAADDTIIKIVHIDLMSPRISIASIQPGLFAPDIISQPATLYIDFDVWDSPAVDGDQARLLIDDPSGGNIVDRGLDSVFAGDGSYQISWDGAEITSDGLYEARIVISDNGGHSSSDWSDINVDKDDPDLHISSIEDGSKLQIIPQTVTGWAWDRNGLNPDSLSVSFSGSIYQPVDSIYPVADTLYYDVRLADSLTEEKLYTLFFKARDNAGREKAISFRITLDLTSPLVPVLDQPIQKTVHSPEYSLTGSFSSDAYEIFFFQNGAKVDSIFAALETTFSHSVTLAAGSNVFQLRTIDQAGNQSPLSNSIEIFFDASSGFFMPQPFRPGDSFQVNPARIADSVEIRIYDLSGELVAELIDPSPAANVSVPWNGLNGDGQSVLRGPLAAVATIRFANRGAETQREVFLFSP